MGTPYYSTPRRRCQRDRTEEPVEGGHAGVPADRPESDLLFVELVRLGGHHKIVPV